MEPILLVALSNAVAELPAAAQLQSGIISSDFVTSVAASSFAENSSVPTDFMNNKTAVIVSDTTTESFDGLLTTDGILTTEYDATKSNTVYINSVLSLNYTVTTPLFYTTDIKTRIKYQFSANDDAATEVTKSDDIIPDCS
jgi:hypothetical protein